MGCGGTQVHSICTEGLYFVFEDLNLHDNETMLIIKKRHAIRSLTKKGKWWMTLWRSKSVRASGLLKHKAPDCKHRLKERVKIFLLSLRKLKNGVSEKARHCRNSTWARSSFSQIKYGHNIWKRRGQGLMTYTKPFLLLRNSWPLHSITTVNIFYLINQTNKRSIPRIWTVAKKLQIGNILDHTAFWNSTFSSTRKPVSM